MRMLGRTAMVLGLACLAQASSLSAQILGFESYKWYFGAQAGVTIFETPAQTRGGIFTAGGHFMVTGRRAGLLVQVDEGIKSDQVSSLSTGGISQDVTFNDLRKYQIALLAFPFRTVAQPYVGVGFGLMQTVKEYPEGPFATPEDEADAQELAHQQGSYTFASFTGGVQIRVARFVAFGQYQITTSPSRGRLLIGPTHALQAGMRISLGGSRDDVGGKGTTSGK